MRRNYSMPIKKGDVFYCQLDKHRPCVVVSGNKTNYTSKNVTVVPLSSKLKRLDLPFHIVLRQKVNHQQAIAMCEIYYTIPKTQLDNYVCTLYENDLSKIKKGIESYYEL